MVDSLDSILMLYAYAGPTQDPSISKFALTFDKKVALPAAEEDVPVLNQESTSPPLSPIEREEEEDTTKPTVFSEVTEADVNAVEVGPSAPQTREQKLLATKANTISSLSITLTLLSILVALRFVLLTQPAHVGSADASISLIEIMGLIGENCTQCTEAAEDPDGGGLAGSWWRAWARVSIPLDVPIIEPED